MIIAAFDIVLGAIAALLVFLPLSRAKRAGSNHRQVDRAGASGSAPTPSDS